MGSQTEKNLQDKDGWMGTVLLVQKILDRKGQVGKRRVGRPCTRYVDEVGNHLKNLRANDGRCVDRTEIIGCEFLEMPRPIKRCSANMII